MYYVWDGAHIIAEYLNGSLTKKYTPGPGIDNPIVMINVSDTTETWYYYYTDALGSVRFITDDEGTIQESYTYYPFGRPRVMISAGTDGNWLTEDVTVFALFSPLGNPYMFTARRWDSSVGLYYYRFRDYHPNLGRFCQPDPIGYYGSMNLYQYCLNSPTNWFDPWGLWHDHNKEFGDGSGRFDYNDLDKGWTSPWNPFSTWRHFRSRDDIAKDLRRAVWAQNARAFEQYMHEWQDSYGHYDKGYRFGHIWESLWFDPDSPEDFPNELENAKQTTKEWEELYDKNPSVEDLADEVKDWLDDDGPPTKSEE